MQGCKRSLGPAAVAGLLTAADLLHYAGPADCLRFRRSSRRRNSDQEKREPAISCLSRIPVLAVRHAESVANVRRKSDALGYARVCWLDDSVPSDTGKEGLEHDDAAAASSALELPPLF